MTNTYKAKNSLKNIKDQTLSALSHLQGNWTIRVIVY